MQYLFYVTDQELKPNDVIIRPAIEEDFQKTISENWQTDWSSPFIQQSHLEKYAMVKTYSKELLGLLACYPQEENNCLRLVYMEAAPNSNPTLVKTNQRKYYGIGKCFLAFATMHCLELDLDCTLVFKAKTTELFRHYIRDFGAIPLRRSGYDLILFPEYTIPILDTYQIRRVEYDS